MDVVYFSKCLPIKNVSHHPSQRTGMNEPEAVIPKQTQLGLDKEGAQREP